MNLAFWNGKRVFLTGHTGFKGAWLCRILSDAGAQVTGFSLEPPTKPNLFEIACIEADVVSIIGDVRDFDQLQKAFLLTRPEIVIHMAAQPIVRESYQNPRYTYETNVMGTINLLECVRLNGGVRSLLNVTTDKVYENRERAEGYREEEPLDGFDPYSNSKSCSELATHSYNNAFLKQSGCSVSTARAGNVIGGGDFASDRIIPDCIRAALKQEPVFVRNPNSTRPYQHVLEPLFAYLTILERQWENPALAGWYNVGPDTCDCVTTGELVDLFCNAWGENMRWKTGETVGPHEARLLQLNCDKMKQTFGWQPRWHIQDAVGQTVAWTRAWQSVEPVHACMRQQIKNYLED
jgi:CDP-glucose 4,6-dehydratase